jgi:hypothetical protein
MKMGRNRKELKAESSKLKGKNLRDGLAGAIRDVMKGSRYPLTYGGLYERLSAKPGSERARILNAVRGDFMLRGEIIKTESGRIKYNHKWRKGYASPYRDKVIKAISLQTGVFTYKDIINLIEGVERNYIEEIMRELVKQGHVTREGRHTTPGVSGFVFLYRVADRLKFRLEVME